MSDARLRFVLIAGVVLLALSGLALLRTQGLTPRPPDSSRPPSVEVVAQNIRVLSGPDRAVRFAFSAAEPSVRVTVRFPDSGSIISVCGLASASSVVPDASGDACIAEIPSGVREELVADTLAAVAIWVRSGEAVDAAIRIEFGERNRELRISLPIIEAPKGPSSCADNGCNPLIEVCPPTGGCRSRNGPFRAAATWRGGAARLALLQGRVLGRSFTATGVPYAVPAERRGTSPLSVKAEMSAPGEYALVLDGNTGTLTDVIIEARWP